MLKQGVSSFLYFPVFNLHTGKKQNKTTPSWDILAHCHAVITMQFLNGLGIEIYTAIKKVKACETMRDEAKRARDKVKPEQEEFGKTEQKLKAFHADLEQVKYWKCKKCILCCFVITRTFPWHLAKPKLNIDESTNSFNFSILATLTHLMTSARTQKKCSRLKKGYSLSSNPQRLHKTKGKKMAILTKISIQHVDN